MDLRYSPEDEAFRLEVREWMEANVPPEVRDAASSRTTIARRLRVPYYKALRARGWMCPKWTKEYGGPGFSQARQIIFMEEAGRIGAPNMDLGVIMASPMIMEFGTAEQKARYLPRMLEAEEMWCQGFSEPEAGSDLANIRTTATLDGDEWVIDGAKTWTSNGHECDRMFLLARTSASGRKQEGISFFLIDMKSPGISVRPIHQITGKSNFTEVFLEKVRAPKDALLGREGQGWEIAMRLLTHERVGVYGGDLIRRTWESVLGLARRAEEGAARNGAPAGRILDPTLREKLARSAMDVEAVCALGYRNVTRIVRGEPPGPESSVIKVFASETYQRVCDIGLEVLGPCAQLWEDPAFGDLENQLVKMALYSRSFTISGGTSEIQRNILAERVLGMPR